MGLMSCLLNDVIRAWSKTNQTNYQKSRHSIQYQLELSRTWLLGGKSQIWLFEFINRDHMIVTYNEKDVLRKN